MTNNVQMVSPSQDEASDKAIEKMDFETLFSCASSPCLLAPNRLHAQRKSFLL